VVTGTDVSCQADEKRWALLPFGGLRTGTDFSSQADERRLALFPFGSLLTRLTDDPVSRGIARAMDRKRSPTDLGGLESFPFSSFRRLRVAAVAGLLAGSCEPSSPGCCLAVVELLICAAVARLRVNRRLAVAGLLTCAAVARPRDNRRCGSRRRAACRFVSAVAGLLTCAAVARLCDNRRCGSRCRAACRFALAVARLHRQPSPGCSPLRSLREAARQSLLGCVSTVVGLRGNSCCGSRCRAACRFVSAVAWPHRQPSPGFVSTVAEVLSSTSAKLRGSRPGLRHRKTLPSTVARAPPAPSAHSCNGVRVSSGPTGGS